MVKYLLSVLRHLDPKSIDPGSSELLEGPVLGHLLVVLLHVVQVPVVVVCNKMALCVHA